MLPASEFVIYFCWKLYYKFQKCRGKIEKRVEEVRIFLTFGPKWEDLLHSKNNLFLIFFKTFFLWCRRYESALYGWVITTFFGNFNTLETHSKYPPVTKGLWNCIPENDSLWCWADSFLTLKLADFLVSPACLLGLKLQGVLTLCEFRYCGFENY